MHPYLPLTPCPLHSCYCPEDTNEQANNKASGEEEEAPADDMGLAWEMLEMARLVYEQAGGGEAHMDELAEIHLALGDILAEQVGAGGAPRTAALLR